MTIDVQPEDQALHGALWTFRCVDGSFRAAAPALEYTSVAQGDEIGDFGFQVVRAERLLSVTTDVLRVEWVDEDYPGWARSFDLYALVRGR